MISHTHHEVLAHMVQILYRGIILNFCVFVKVRSSVQPTLPPSLRKTGAAMADVTAGYWTIPPHFSVFIIARSFVKVTC